MNIKNKIINTILGTGYIISLSGCATGTDGLLKKCIDVNEKESITQCTFVDDKTTTILYGTKNMPYALCSKIICDYDAPSQQAHCLCDIQSNIGWTSASIGPSPYISAQPTWDNANQLQTLQSNYSKANVSDLSIPSSSSCHFETPKPWAYCFGVRCQVQTVTVNNKPEKMAACTCPVIHTKDFVIGYSDDSYCQQPNNKAISGTYSGNFSNNGNQAIMDMYQKYYPGLTSVKDN